MCLCDLDRGLNQLSDLMILQLGFWLQQQRGGGGTGVSHGVLVMGVRGTSGVESVFPVLFPKRFPTEFLLSRGEEPDSQGHRCAMTVVLVRVLN